MWCHIHTWGATQVVVKHYSVSSFVYLGQWSATLFLVIYLPKSSNHNHAHLTIYSLPQAMEISRNRVADHSSELFKPVTHLLKVWGEHRDTLCILPCGTQCHGLFLTILPSPWHPITSSEPVLLLPNVILPDCNAPFAVQSWSLPWWSLKESFALPKCSKYWQFECSTSRWCSCWLSCLFFSWVRRILGLSVEYSLHCILEVDLSYFRTYVSWIFSPLGWVSVNCCYFMS